MPKPIIQVKDLTKRYRKSNTNAVDNISFEVYPGEMFALLGPNGAGKTTTISILTTTLAKTSGSITIAGFDLDHQSSQVRQSCGIIFQNPSLDLNLTAEENVRFHAILYGLYPFRPSFSLMPKAYQQQAQTLAQVLDLQEHLFKPIKTFSGGMKRKLEIIRSIIHQPKVLFLDEPTSGLDPLSRRNLWLYLNQIRLEKQMTIFLTTHYLEEAESADTICIINQGQIAAQGTPDQIKQHLIQNFLILESNQPKKLTQELKALNLNFESTDKIKIYLQPDLIQATVKKIKTPLSNIITHTPTLEDAYLELIDQRSKLESQK